ncbi:hypothetical protein [Brachybacterium nesterenkovii]|uniref:hypothetical protein n=1 Tax=Brachybacterium nesterenkovii TaxID=47847 RepID=UPI00321A00C3
MNRRPHEGALADRWTLEGTIPLSGCAEGASWHRARAARSGDPAAVMLVEGEAALETADAARRALLVEHERLLPVLDVEVLGEDAPARSAATTEGPAGKGSAGASDDADAGATDPEADAADGPLTIVSYPFPPAPPLAALLSKGALRPETARSIIGEAATGLEAARRRGLRHVHLDSNRVFVDTRSGDVRVLGVGVETAAHGTADPSGDEAAAQDVVSLITLLFRALTGRVPRPGADGSFPRPSALASRRVPEDLDDLCDRVLNGHDDVPLTTRELLEELGPWQSIPVTLQAYDPTEDAAKPAAEESAAATSAAAGPAAAEADRSATASSAGAADAGSTDAGDHGTGVAAAELAAGAAGAGLAAGAVAAPESAGDEQGTAAAAEANPPAPPVETSTPDAGTAPSTSSDASDDAAGSNASDAAAAAASDDPATPGSDGPATPASDGSTTARTGALGAAIAAGALSLREKAAERRAARRERLAARAEERAAAQGAAEQDPTGARTTEQGPTAQGTTAPGDAAQRDPAQTYTDAVVEGAAPSTSSPAAHGADASGSAAADQTGAAPADGTATAEGTDPATSQRAEAEVRAEAEAAAAHEARGLVQDLHLTEHRGASAFPGSLAVVPAPSRLAPDAEDDDPALPSADRSADSSGSTPEVEDEETGDAPLAAAVGPVIVGAAGDRSPEDGPIIVPGRSRPIAPVEEEADAWSATPTAYLRDVVGVAMDRDSDRTYVLGPQDGQDRSRQALWILIGGVVLVIIAVVLAFSSITAALRDPATAPSATPSSSAAAAATTPAAEQSAAAAPAPAESSQPAAPPVIAAVTEVDDGKPDHPEDAGRMNDGDPGTVWRSKIYRSETFGNIKPGIGITVDLAAPATVNAVVVTTKESQGGLIELRTVNDDGSMGDPVASGAFAGDGEVRLAPGAPLTTQKLMLWIPQAPTDSKGNRAQIAEIRVE